MDRWQPPQSAKSAFIQQHQPVSAVQFHKAAANAKIQKGVSTKRYGERYYCISVEELVIRLYLPSSDKCKCRFRKRCTNRFQNAVSQRFTKRQVSKYRNASYWESATNKLCINITRLNTAASNANGCQYFFSH